MKARPRRTLWRVSAALAILLIVLIVGHYLHDQRRADAVRTADSDVRDALDSYFAALAEGDLVKLRALTCPGYHDGFFGKVDPEQYRSVHDNEAAAGGAIVLDSIDSVLLTPPTAKAQATAHTEAVPQRQRLVFELRQTNGAWQLCDAEPAEQTR